MVGTLLAVEPAHQAQDLELVREVQVGRRFVEQQRVGLLRHHQGDPCTLSLATRQARDVAVCDVGQAGRRDGLLRDVGVVRGPRLRPRLVRVAAAHHQVEHARAGGGDGRLRQDRELPRDLAVRFLADRGTVEQDLAGLRLQHPPEGLEQGRLAAAVRAEERRHGAALDAQVEIGQHGVPVVADGQAAGFEDRGGRGCRRGSHRDISLR
ncbi:hypothetical protein QP157_09125 [Sphingomonas sp. LR61]